MAIAVGAATTATGNNVSSYTLNVPSGTTDGDMLLLAVAVSESSGVESTISGTWTQKARIDQVTSGDDHDNCLKLFWRRASSEPGSYTVTPDGTYGNYSVATMIRYTGVILSGDPFRTSATGTGGAALGTPKTSVSLSGVQSTDMAVHFAGTALSNWNGNDYDLAGPGGSWAQHSEIIGTAITSTPGLIAIGQAGTGTAPSLSATGTGSTNIAWTFIAGALMEEPPAAPGGPKIYATAVHRASNW